MIIIIQCLAGERTDLIQCLMGLYLHNSADNIVVAAGPPFSIRLHIYNLYRCESPRSISLLPNMMMDKVRQNTTRSYGLIVYPHIRAIREIHINNCTIDQAQEGSNLAGGGGSSRPIPGLLLVY